MTRLLPLAARFLVCLGGGLLLAACTLPGSVKPAIKIGLSAPFEGLDRDLGYEVLYGVRLAVRQRNEAGGLGGRFLVELVALNDFNEPGEAVWQAREMAADPDIMAVLGGWSPATARAARPEYDRLLIPLITARPDPSRLGVEAARVAGEEMAARRAAVVSTGDPDDLAMAGSFARAFAADGNDVVTQATPPRSEWLADLVAAQPDLVFIAADAPQAAQWMSRARQAGFRGRFLGGPGLGSRIVVDIAGAAAEEALYLSPYPPMPDDPEWAAAYRELSGGAPPGPAGAWAYAAARDVLDRMEKTSALAASDRRALPSSDEPGPSGTYVYAIRQGRVFQQP